MNGPIFENEKESPANDINEYSNNDDLLRMLIKMNAERNWDVCLLIYQIMMQTRIINFSSIIKMQPLIESKNGQK